ncbi:triose-phosphate transporter family domain-containing protein [Trichoderma camerunense]
MSRRSQDVALLSPDEQDLKHDLESGKIQSESKDQNIDHEYSIPSAVKFTWLGTYFLFSLILTLYNKLVLGVFHFPWLLTFLHTLFASLGTYAMLQMGYFKLSRLGRRENLALVAFSALFTANIAVSNLSLAMVSVPFYQTMRMLCPIFTIIIFRVWYGRTYSTMTYMSLIPLIIGAAMTTAGEMSFSDAGFILTILGVVLAALKVRFEHVSSFTGMIKANHVYQTVVTNRFMTGSLALPPVEFLMRMSPLAALQALACATATGEVAGFRELIRTGDISIVPATASLAGNGFLALLLNISSFNTNKLAGALTMTVCGNLKQCLTVMIGIFLFNVSVDFLNGSGMAVTMVGAAIYSKAELDNKNRKKQQEAAFKPTEQR